MRKLAVAYPWNVPFICTGFADSALNMRSPDGWEVRWFRAGGWCPARRHNRGIEQALKWGADLICLLDPDQIHPEDMLPRLVSRMENDGCDTIAAVVPLRKYTPWNGMQPYQPMAWHLNDDGTYRRYNPSAGALQEVHSVGSGVFMFRASDVKKLKMPWFDEQILDKERFRREGGQDIRFVRKLGDELGLKIWIDTGIKIKHLAMFGIDDSFTQRFSDAAPEDRHEGLPAAEDDDLGGWSIDRACFDRIVELLPEGGTILELGSGKATRELSGRYNVYSVEDSEEHLFVHHDQYIHAPIKDGWYDRDALVGKLPSKYDLLLVDGPSHTNGRDRMGFLNNRDLFNLDVPIVMDDVNRSEEGAVLLMLSRVLGREPEITRCKSKDFAVLQP